MTTTSLINVGELAKPITVLIEKISDAIGGIYKPFQTVHIANAEAQARIISAEADIKVTELQQRAATRFFQEEMNKQQNIEAITVKAIPLLEETINPEKLENDWIVNFFDKCRLTSDEDMQKLWAQVLAGEANNPGNFSKKTVNILSDLSKKDAESFQQLVRYCCELTENDLSPIVLGYNAPIYTDNGINFSTLTHLESLGLIRMNTFPGYSMTYDEKDKLTIWHYFNQSLELRFPESGDLIVGIGKVLFTQAGEELAKICEKKPIDGFFEFLHKHLIAQKLIEQD